MKIKRHQVVRFVIIETDIGDIRVWPTKLSMDIWNEKMNDWDYLDEADITETERQLLFYTARNALAHAEPIQHPA